MAAFQFKQFTIEQQVSAMKVTTDACLFGAFVATETPSLHNKKVLDIGAGTGLLSLMMAQQHPTAEITAIEIEASAVGEARQNFQQSPWRKNLQLVEGDILTQEFDSGFDLVITNPPFYENQLKGPGQLRNIAHHDGGLLLPALVGIIKKLLKPGGEAWILLPFYRKNEIQDLANAHGLLAKRVITVQPFAHKTPTRIMACLNFEQVDMATAEEIFVVYEQPKAYTAAFIQLLKPYYLHL